MILSSKSEYKLSEDFGVHFQDLSSARRDSDGASRRLRRRYFPDFVKNGAPHERAANSDWIEGRAPRKSTKNLFRNYRKTAGKRRRTNHVFWNYFEFILGGSGDHFGTQNAFKNQVKIWMQFWTLNKNPGDLFWVGPAECAGPWGR